MTKSSRQSYISIDARKSRRSFEEDFDFDIDEDSDSESDNWESDASSDSNDDSSNNDSDSSGSQNEYKREWDNKNKNKERDDNEDEYSDSSDDSDNDSQWKEDQKTKQKIFAILLTVVCLILLASAIGLGVAMSQKSDETQVDKSTALQSPTTTPVVTSMPTSNATTFAPSSAPSNPTTLTPTVSPTVDTFANETSCDGGNETSCGDEALAPDIFENYFNVSEDSVIPYDPYAIPGEIVVNPSGDTYVLALPEGEVVVREPGAPPEDFGTSPTLLVRSRNSVDGTIPVEDWEVGNFAGSNSTGDEDGNEDGNEDGSEDGDEEDKVGLLPANASSYALLNFNMEAYPWFNNTNADLRSKTTKAYLCLYQKTHSNEVDPWGNSRMNETSGNFTKKRFAVCRVENAVGEDLTAPEGKAPTGADVEQIAPGVANYSMPEDCMDGLVARTFVVPDVSMVCIDASPFVNKYPPFVDDPYAVVDDESSVVEDDDVVTSEIPVRHRYLRKKKKDKNKQETSSEKRNLQEDAESIVDRSNYKNLLFMIAYIEKGRDASAEFYSREKNETVAPVLIWQFDESAAPSESPTMTPGPTDLTTAGPQPSSIPTLAPSTSSIPTLVPSTTNTIELSNSTNEDNFDSNSTTPDQGVDEDASLEDGNVTVGEEDEEFLGDGNVTVAEEDGEFLGDGNVTVAEEDGEFLGDGNTTVGEEDEQFLGDGNVTVTAEDGNTTVGIDDEDLPGNETTTLVATMDTYFSPSKGGQPELPGLEETLLVQNGEPSYEETNALVSFNINIDPLPNEASFCLEHVPTRPTSTVDTRTYTTCMVPYIDDIETLTGTDISYTMPESCIGELSAEFVVSPLTERICTDVSSFFLQPGGFQEGAGTKTILFMIANLVADEEAGDRFYSISDPLERYPTLEFSSGVLVI
eukprot:CAMPEP_0168311658 /NCGR_PEP_ID=MMETSP0142_2-20121227/67477_1 /TAXON_ID=44445 /ORGANISM="Pseudo-nitzschia australis, Strain 10249 10 AB" /LENGTH=917 /DNA_ID=CAMNT_0008264567 /DNA_START=1693 /DNA_END=4446 /DNA_ORIENTATION=+